MGSAFRACSNPVKVTRIACFFVGMEVAAASFEGGEALVGEVGYLASHLQVRIRNIHPSTIAGFQIDYISKIKLVIYRVIQCSLCLVHMTYQF